MKKIKNWDTGIKLVAYFANLSNAQLNFVALNANISLGDTSYLTVSNIELLKAE